ncbi:FAD/NAD(P)-binding protein [Salipaludibacillus sp. CF4.18]|uniref:FAD/NAD(P)-binding protein n=1 Tax=Salipaludibacillus sp. CF4.18 TaxID=3373081 RepID=UPI003EE6C71E
MYEWAIIGGGIHGCTVANFLLAKGLTTTSKLSVIDPHSEPLHMWKRNTKLIGMEYLRSPSVHHIDLDPFSLQKYQENNHDRKELYGNYKRPSLNLFNDHADKTLENVNIHRSWHQGKVSHASRKGDGWRIITELGNEVFTKNIVIAISLNHQLKIPEWVASLKSARDNIYHVYDKSLTSLENVSGPVTVIGGGITAQPPTLQLN